MFSIKKITLVELLLIIIYRISLDIGYYVYVSKVYEYNGFYFNPDSLKYFESFVYMILIAVLLKKNDSRLSSITTKLLYVTMIVPTLSLYALNDGPRVFIYYFIAGFILTLLVTKLPFLKMPRIALHKYITFLILSICTIFTYLVLLIYNGLPTLKALDLLSVYEIRNQVVFGPSIMGYLVVWQAKVINLFLFGLGIYKKSIRLIVISFGLQLFLFLIIGSKGTLFAPLFVLAILFVLKKNRFLIYSVLGLTVVVVGSLVVNALGISGLPATLFIRRTLFVPAINYFYYYDFFSQNQFVYLSHSIFKFIIEYPYSMPAANLIGDLYYGNQEGWINTGYLADAYMNFGFIGMLVFSIILGFILLILDSIARNSDPTIVISTSIIGLFSLLDGALLTVLMTHGVLFAMFVLILFTKGQSVIAKTNVTLGSGK